jgi:hypothetical protein
VTAKCANVADEAVGHIQSHRHFTDDCLHQIEERSRRTVLRT